MGLSGRRRARKETRTSRAVAPSNDELTPCADSHHELHHHRHRQSIHKSNNGNTYRRVHSSIAKELKHASLLEFGVNRSFREDLLPPRQKTHPDIGAQPNANLYNRKMLRIFDNDYTESVWYSLNKKSRWQFAKQLKDRYDSSEELKAQNIFVMETEARRPKSNNSASKVTTNATYMIDAAKELRHHKRKLEQKCTWQLKEQVLAHDQFEFSEQIATSREERPLVSQTPRSGSGGINVASLRRSCNLWNHLYNVSPKAEAVRADLQRDYEARLEVFVGTSSTGGLDTNRMRQWEKQTRSCKMNCPDANYHRDKLIASRAKKMRRSEMDVQLGLDGCSEQLDQREELQEETQEEEEQPVAFSREVTLLDAMRAKPHGWSANRAKKLAQKAQKARKAERVQSQQLLLLMKKKQRNDSEETTASSGGGTSSGYSSGRDDGSRGDDQQQPLPETPVAAEPAADARMMAAVEAALTTERPRVRVAKATAEPARLAGLFDRRQLLVGGSVPRKLAVLLRPDLAEAVVFQEAGRDAATVTFAVHHGFSGQDAAGARTSAREVASQADPFAFLRGLLADEEEASSLKETTKLRAVNDYEDDDNSGWLLADVVAEADARLAAVRSLPMFSDELQTSSGCCQDEDVDADDADAAVLVPGLECEICCRDVGSDDGDHDDDGSGSFAAGFTMLTGCGHCFCNHCWLRHVAAGVARGRAGVACPGFKCHTPLDAATLLWFCPSDLLAALSAAAFRAWLSERRRGGRERRLLRRYCPQANCGRLLESRSGVNAVCAACSRGLCLGCGQEPHWPSDCATAAEYRKKMTSLGHEHLFQRDLEAEAEVNAKQCPSCSTIMEKGFGCNHMTCPCGEHFCWWCGQSMSSHRSGPCFSSMSGRTKSSYRVKRVFTAKDSYLVPNSSQSRLYCAAVKARLFRQSSPARLRSCRLAIADLFVSYAIRFPIDTSGSSGGDRVSSWQEASAWASHASDRLVDTSVRASYLVEYAYAHMDRHSGCRRTSAVVRTVGSHVEQLVKSLTGELREQSRQGYRGPKRTKEACERLLMMLECLQRQSRLLRCIVAGHCGDKTKKKKMDSLRRGKS